MRSIFFPNHHHHVLIVHLNLVIYHPLSSDLNVLGLNTDRSTAQDLARVFTNCTFGQVTKKILEAKAFTAVLWIIMNRYERKFKMSSNPNSRLATTLICNILCHKTLIIINNIVGTLLHGPHFDSTQLHLCYLVLRMRDTWY